jgi:hypothetical protein
MPIRLVLAEDSYLIRECLALHFTDAAGVELVASVASLTLSPHLEADFALRLFDGGARGRAYLLKERVGDLIQLRHAIEVDQATFPGSIEVDGGTVLFVDNRDPVRHTFTVEGTGIDVELPARQAARVPIDLTRLLRRHLRRSRTRVHDRPTGRPMNIDHPTGIDRAHRGRSEEPLGALAARGGVVGPVRGSVSRWPGTRFQAPPGP